MCYLSDIINRAITNPALLPITIGTQQITDHTSVTSLITSVSSILSISWDFPFPVWPQGLTTGSTTKDSPATQRHTAPTHFPDNRHPTRPCVLVLYYLWHVNQLIQKKKKELSLLGTCKTLFGLFVLVILPVALSKWAVQWNCDSDLWRKQKHWVSSDFFKSSRRLSPTRRWRWK